MKMIFKIHPSNTCFYWQRALAVLMFVGTLAYNSYGQEAEYSERDYGTLITRRNDPTPYAKIDSTIIRCRKSNKVKEVFILDSEVFDISQALIKPFENLTEGELYRIITNAWSKRDTSLLPFLLKIAQCDTFIDYIYVRKLSVESLSRFNNDTVKKVLTNLLEDKDVGMVSALSLAQLGQTDQALQYIQTHYSENTTYHIIPDIVTVLMMINNPEAVKLLMKISEHKDPSQALDALAALSLLGYCDFAYQGFCKYITSNVWIVRTKVVTCLLFYTGTPEAIDIAKNMYYSEKDKFAKGELEYGLKRFNIFIGTK